MVKERKPWKPPDAAEVVARWKQCEADTLYERREHGLNEAFFSGNQWVTWNDSSGLVDIVRFADAADAKVRATVNKIKPRTITYMARLLATPLSFEPRPEGTDANAVRKARLAGMVLDVKSHRDGWSKVRQEELQHAMFGGVSAVTIEPDWEFGDDEIVDQETGDTVRMPSRPRTKLDALGITEFGIEPGTRQVSDARWWIRRTTLTPEQCMDRYPVLTEPPPADADRDSSVMARALLSRRNEGTRTRATAVYIYYERPSEDGSRPGCVLHVLAGRIVQQSGWPFPFDRLNIRTFVQTPVAGSWRGETIMSDARPLQVTINRAQTTINAHLGKVDNPRMLLPIGAVIEGDDEFTGDVGEIVRYDPQAGAPPSWMQAPQMQRWLPDAIPNMEAQLDDLFSAHAVSRGQAPGDRNSGLALSILAEKDSTPLGIMATDQQAGWQDVAEMVLMTEKGLMKLANAQYAKNTPDGQEPTQMQVSEVRVSQGEDGSEQLTDVVWTADDLPDFPVVSVPLEAVMPISLAAQQDMLLKLSANPAFVKMFANMTPSQLANTLRLPNRFAFQVYANTQEAEAEWENTRMAAGAGDNEVIVQTWQNHDIHVPKHNELRASASYRNASPEVRDMVDRHVDAHAKLAADELQGKQQAAAMAAAQPVPGAAPGQPPVPTGPPDQGQQVPAA